METNLIKAERKRYLSEADLKTMFDTPKREPVIVSAAPGTGKTTSILKRLKTKAELRGEKIILIVNRSSLRQQLLQDIIKIYEIDVDVTSLQDRKYFIIDNLVVTSYQYLAELMDKSNTKDIKIGIFKASQFAYCCADEIHYLEEDSSFSSNSFQILRLAKVFYNAKRIYMTGTLTTFLRALILEIEEIIDNEPECEGKSIFGECRFVKAPSSIDKMNACYSGKRIFYNSMKVHEVYGPTLDYDRFEINFVDEKKELKKCILDSLEKGGNNKIIAFVKSKSLGIETMQALRENKISTAFIFAEGDNMHMDRESKEAFEEIARCNLFSQRVLITTSILNNGVSIIDPNISHIFTEEYEYIPVVQEVSRVRLQDDNQKICLFFRKYSEEFFKSEIQHIETALHQMDIFANSDTKEVINFLITRKYDAVGRLLSCDKYKNLRVNNLAVKALENKREYINQILCCKNPTMRFVQNLCDWFNCAYDPDKDQTELKKKVAKQNIISFIIESMRQSIPKEEIKDFYKKLQELYQMIPGKERSLCSGKGKRTIGTRTAKKVLGEFGYALAVDYKTQEYKITEQEA